MSTLINNLKSIYRLNHLDIESQIKEIYRDPWNIRFIKNKTEELQQIAVKEDAYVIEYIKKTFESVQLIAVNINGHLIKFIKNPSETVQLAAIKQTPIAIRYIKTPCEAAQIEAVIQYPYMIRHIKDPFESTIIACLNVNSTAMLFKLYWKYRLIVTKGKLFISQARYNYIGSFNITNEDIKLQNELHSY